MKFSINIIALILCAIVSGQTIKNSRTVEVHISGNCGMCENTIEEAGSQSGISTLDWDKNSKLAVVTYDISKTNLDAILENVAKAGYDSYGHNAPLSAYENLPMCCQYNRDVTPKILDEKVESNYN